MHNMFLLLLKCQSSHTIVLSTLEHGVTQTATTTIVVVLLTPLSPVALGTIDPLHCTVTQMTRFGYGV